MRVFPTLPFLLLVLLHSSECKLQSTIDKIVRSIHDIDEERLEATDVSDYSIPYDKTAAEFGTIDYEKAKSGDEIDMMDVSGIKKPNQIRLSYTGVPTEMALTWTTNAVTHHELVRFGEMGAHLNYTAFSVSHQYTWDWQKDTASFYYTSGFIHEVLLINLVPGRIHYYQIESNGEKSPVMKFVASPEPGSRTPLSFMHVGDVGTFGTSLMVTKDMMDRMKELQFHGMVHCGDISYANGFNHSRPAYAEQKVWDTWGQMVEPIGSKMPYMVTPGNHELDVYDSTNENATIYSKRFIMPGNERYYSFGVGMVYFVAVSTDESIDPSSTQGVWLDRELARINEERDTYPWLVVFQHRPIYNSNLNHGNWTGNNTYTRPDRENIIHDGWPDNFEELILSHGVDLVLAGHVHQYERSWPVRDRDHVTKSYQNKKDPVHICCGHGGKGLYKWKWGTNYKVPAYQNAPEFSAARNNEDWGHCELHFIDATTVEHRMYTMGKSTPDEKVLITTSRSSGNKAVFSAYLVAIAALISIMWC